MAGLWRCLAVVAVWMCAGAAFAAEPTPAELKAKFQETIAASRLSIEVKGGRLSGPGAEFLKARAAAAQFFLIGEEHGVATIADTMRALFADLHDAGYGHFAIEADAYMTDKLEKVLRKGGTKGLAKFISAEEAKFAVPFYSWSAEAELADAVVRANGGATPALWGLDQVFIGAYGLLLRDIETNSVFANQAKGDLGFLGKVDVAVFESLRALLNGAGDEGLARMVDDMILSAKIYAPFIGRDGLSVYAANLERENFMKRQFLSHYVQAEKPKVFFKFGAYHMSRGLSGTHVPSLANFVADYAQAEGVKAFNVLVLCGPGSKAGDFQGGENECDMTVEKDFPDLVGKVDAKQPTLFDLAPWKDEPQRWAHLGEEVRHTLWAYDAVLFVPNGKPAKFLK
jgi:hypothetical protein